MNDSQVDAMLLESELPPETSSVSLGDLAEALESESQAVGEDYTPDAETIEREALQRVNPLLQAYAARLRTVQLDEFDAVFDDLIKQVWELEKEIGKGVIPEGYVAESAHLDTLLEVAARFDRKLPKRHRLKSSYAMDLATNLVQNWFQKTWGQALLHIVNLDLYLEHRGPPADLTTLPESVEQELYQKAAGRLAEVEQLLKQIYLNKQQRATQPTSENDPENPPPTEEEILEDEAAENADIEDLSAEQSHLIQLLLGRHAPFNTERYHRWRSFDLMHIFMPLAGTHELSVEQTQFMVTIAKSLCNDTDSEHSPDNWVPAAKALTFLETGTLPAPWLANRSFFEQPVEPVAES